MNGNVDPRIDKMVAYLYGELPEAEERAFRRLLEKDDALRAEYEELSGTRETLRDWQVEERVPSFVMMPSAAPGPARVSRASGDGWLARLLEPLRGFAVTPAWGLAAAALVLLVLAVGGFRVERVDGGVAFRFGESTEPATQTTVPARAPAQLATTPIPRPAGSQPENVALPVGQYLTREDLSSYDSDLMLTLAELLNAYGRKRDREVTEGFQSFYQQVSTRSDFDYEQLSGRIDVLGRELLLETDRNARGFEEVLRTQPANKQPLSEDEED